MADPPHTLERLLEWTGERWVPWVDDPSVLYEHLHRYFFAASLAEGRRVLDLGSGEGFGASLLAETAADVLAVELDAEAVEHARRNYGAPNLEFRQGSILELDDLADDSRDLVVCLEVIEHVAEHETLLALVARALAPGGLFVVSTPDRDVYTGLAGNDNPFHVRELSRAELGELLGSRFGHHVLWSQSPVVGSVLRRDGEPAAVETIEAAREGDVWQRGQAPPDWYLLAVASDAPLPALPDLSLLTHRTSHVLSAPASLVGQAYELWEPERLARQVAIFEAALAAELAARQALERELAEATRERDALQAQLDELTGSRAWRAVTQYRRARNGLRARRGGA